MKYVRRRQIHIAKLPKCPECNYLVDKDTQEHVKHSAKTYHQRCFEEFEMRKQQRLELHEYICYLYGMPKVNGFILKQIKEYETDYGYKLSGMKLALEFFHEIQGNSTELDKRKYNTQGIGIIPYVYDDARIFFMKKHKAGLYNSEIDYSNAEKVVYIKIKKKKKKLIDINQL